MTAPSQLSCGARWAVVLLLPVVTCAVAHLAFTPGYGSNDDTVFAMLAAGRMLTDQPSPFLLYPGPGVGYPVSRLYAACPDVPWYYAFQVGTHVLAGWVAAHAVLIRRPTWARAGLLAAYFATVELPLYTQPQFTISSGMAAVAAVMLWLSRGPTRPWSVGTGAIFLGLIALSAAWRVPACAMVLGLAAPLAALRFAHDWLAAAGRGPHAVVRGPVAITGLPFAAAFAVLAGVHFHHAWLYRTTPGWERFYEYNSARAKLTDFQMGWYGSANSAAYAACGWHPEDYEMVLSWCLLDTEVHSPEKLMTIAAASPEPELSLKKVPKVWMAATRGYVLSGLVVSWAGLILLVLPPTWRAWAVYAVGVATAAATWTVVGVNGHYPPHVLYVIAGFVMLLGLTLSDPDTSGAARGPFLRSMAAAGVVLGFVCYPVYRDARDRSKLLREGSNQLEWMLEAVKPKPSDLFVFWADAFPLQLIKPWQDARRYQDLNGYILGCLTNTPHAAAQLSLTGVTNPTDGLLTRNNVYLVVKPHNLTVLSRFLARRRGVRVEYEPVFEGLAADPINRFQVLRVKATGPVGG